MKRHSIWICLLLVLMVFLSCGRGSGINAVRAGDYRIVSKGTYRGHLQFQGNSGGQLESVKKLRAEIEKDEMMILNKISDRFYMIPHAPYKFKFAAIDEAADYLVLRYFARIFEHPVYAGYQIQFVYTRNSGKLLKIYTAEVPLE